jgi:hypothetical protein
MDVRGTMRDLSFYTWAVKVTDFCDVTPCIPVERGNLV